MHALGEFCQSESLNSCHMSEYEKLLKKCVFLLGFVGLVIFDTVTE